MYAFTRVHASVARRSHREETHVRAEGIERELGRETKTERERRKRGRQGDGSCVCTTRRVYQATSVVTAIVPTTSPAGRHPRSIRLSSFPSRPPWSSASCRIPSDSSHSREPLVFSSSSRGRSYSPIFLELFLPPCLEFLASLPFSFLIFGAINVFTSGRKVNSSVTSSPQRRASLPLPRGVVKCVRDQIW